MTHQPNARADRDAALDTAIMLSWRERGIALLAALAAWGLALLGALLLVPDLAGQGTPAGTRITSIAKVTYEADNGLTYTVFADPDPPGSELVVARVGGVDLEAPGASVTDPGGTVLFRHTLRNLGNAPDTFGVSASSRAGWPVRLYRDGNGNGLLDDADVPATDPIPLGYGETVALLLAIDVPLQAIRGSTDTLRLTAASRFDPRATDGVTDLVEIRSPGIVITLEKSVDRATAALGDILTYTIRYGATGSSTATNVFITDPIPAGTRYVTGSLRLNGLWLTDAGGDDGGSFDPVANRVAVTLPAVAAGETGLISFQVRVGS